MSKTSNGSGGDAITAKINDECRRPYLSGDQNHFPAGTPRPQKKHVRQVLKHATSDVGGDAITKLLQLKHPYRAVGLSEIWDHSHIELFICPFSRAVTDITKSILCPVNPDIKESMRICIRGC